MTDSSLPHLGHITFSFISHPQCPEKCEEAAGEPEQAAGPYNPGPCPCGQECQSARRKERGGGVCREGTQEPVQEPERERCGHKPLYEPLGKERAHDEQP